MKNPLKIFFWVGPLSGSQLGFLGRSKNPLTFLGGQEPHLSFFAFLRFSSRLSVFLKFGIMDRDDKWTPYMVCRFSPRRKLWYSDLTFFPDPPPLKIFFWVDSISGSQLGFPDRTKNPRTFLGWPGATSVFLRVYSFFFAFICFSQIWDYGPG